MNRYAQNRCNQGFTLVELLVVVGIIAALMGILMPSLYDAKEEARRVVCATQLRGMGTTMHLYQEDNEGRFPEFFFHFSPGHSGTIVILIQPPPFARGGLNIFDPQLLVCPSDREPGTTPVRQPDGTVTQLPMSYGYNIDFFLRDKKYTEIFSPSDTVIFYDGSLSGPGGGGVNIQGHYHGATDFVNETLVRRHSYERANVLHADWHVTTIDADNPIPERKIIVDNQPISTTPNTGQPGSGSNPGGGGPGGGGPGGGGPGGGGPGGGGPGGGGPGGGGPGGG